MDQLAPPVVLHDDAHLIAVDKPAGLLTQGLAGGEPTLERAVRDLLGLDPSAFLGTVHRLDRPVSGVVLWAKNEKAARRLSAQFAAREAAKEYWAVVDGPLPGFLSPPPSGTWDDWLAGSADGSGLVRAVPQGSPGARRAIARFQVGQPRRFPAGATWLILRPETGRTHQLRVQASLRGLPVRGDVPYGSTTAFAQGIALHARSLTLEHPTLLRTITFNAPPPSSWKAQGIDLPSTS